MSRFTSWLGADLRYALKNTAIAVGFLTAANACGGGGCASSCAGSSVIPGGFPKDKRVENAAGVRLTRPGLDFLEKNLGAVLTKVLGMSASGGVMTFPINETTGSVTVLFIPVSYTICVGGPKPTEMPPKCVVEINVAGVKNVKINADKPNELVIAATIPIRLRNLPIKAAGISATAALTNGSASSCDTGEYVDMPITADISLETVPNDAKHAVRAGYTKINIKKLDFDQKTLQDNMKFCGSGIGTDILNALKGLIIGNVIGGLTGNLTAPLASATCMSPQKLPDGTEQCPTDTFNKNGKCRFENKDDGECVPMLLGLESRFDLSGLLASLSPGTSGGLDFMLASGGNMEPAPGTTTAENGATLHMLGGGQPFPISTCVPAVDNPLPTGIQLPDELFKNTVDGWTAPTPPHLGIGLAERFLNHAATGAYNSGLFCIGISSEQVSQLNAGLFSLLLRSIDGLADKFKASDSSPAMALSIRPQKAPAITIGDNKADFTSPLLDLKLTDTDLDFYMWSHERFIRLFTGRIDIEVPINMEAGKDGIGLKFAPKNPLSFTNPRISNNNLLLEDDKAVGNLVASIGGLIPASTFSAIKPFKLDSALASLGLKLTIPEGGIRKVTKGDDRFLGIFAYLEVATAAIPQTMTSARIVKSNIDPANFKLETVGTAPPSFDVHASALEDNGSKKVEYAYKVDNGPYSVFMPERDFTVTSPFFILQGKHTISVVSRIAGSVESESEPVTLPVLIDVLAPRVKVETKTEGVATILAGDLISQGNDLKVEARVDGGAWIPVMADDKGLRTVKVAPESAQIEVRATDEAGNVGSTSAALIRGRSDQLAPSSSGCGCSVPGNDTTPTGLATFGALAALGAVIERRRRRNKARDLAAASIVPLAFGVAGCSCGASGDDNAGAPTCNGKSDLVSFVIGSHTSVATAADGTVWVAGYNEGDPSGGSTEDFQADLVVGKWDSSAGKVKWQIIDGYPKPDANTQLDHNNCGWREGVTDPGDDVGQFTAMQLDAQNNPVVAYFDRTNGALKVARFDGSSWSTHQVDAQTTGWAGKHNAMVMVDGKPVVAYQSVEAGSGGFAKVKVRVAKAQTATPSSNADWSIEDAIVEEKNPCTQAVCGAGQKCLIGVAGTFDPVCTATTGGCMPACASDTEACVKDKMGVAGCQKIKPTLGIYVNALGEAISLATSGSDLVLVAYDRWHGNLRSATNKGGTWKSTPPDAPLDGWTGDPAKDKTTGDRGFGASLAVDSTGNWHVVYADGIKEWLLYRFVPGGDVSKAAAPILVDDGATTDGMTKFTDGQHVIGDTAWITLDGSNVKVVYQDTTAGTLRWAKGAGGPMAKFTRGVIKQDGFAGFWPRFAGSQVLNFFRQRGLTEEGGDKVIIGDVRAATIP
ncbi:MAG: MYXO-CTERM sorting domain-containing protein [Polyangiales bacterium]